MKKKFLALVLTLAMVLSLVPVTALATDGTPTPDNATQPRTSVTADTEDGVHISKKVVPDGDNYNLVMEAYVEGTTTTTTSTKPLDIVLVLDVSGSMDDPMGKKDSKKRIAALKTAVNTFIDNVAEKNTSTDGTAVGHKISIVKFAGDKTDKVGDDTYREFGYTYNYSQIVKNLTTVDATGKEDLKTAVNGLGPAGATRADYGMELAQTELNSNLTDQSRDKVVVMFTDGSPNSSNGFEYDVASSAIANSATLKGNNVKVYTVGIFSGANSREITANDWNTEWNVSDSNRNNKYMQAVSSNYPTASLTYGSIKHSWNPGQRAEGKYYLTATDADGLKNVFQEISDSITRTTVMADESAVLRDTLMEQFVLNGDANKITVKKAEVKRKDGNAYTWKTPVDVTEITKDISEDGKTVTVTGFNYTSEDNVITENNGKYSGHKLIVTIPIKVNEAYEGWKAGTKNYDTNVTNTEDQKAGLTNYKKREENASTLLNESPQIPVAAYTVTYQYSDNHEGAPPLTNYNDGKAYLPGKSITIKNAPTWTGYTFSGWTTSDAEISNDKFEMPAQNVELTGSWNANNNVSYTVHYYKQGTTDKVAEDKTVTGKTFNTEVTETAETVSGYTVEGEPTRTITLDAYNKEITFYYTANTYTVTWMNGNDQLKQDNDVPYNAQPNYGGTAPTKAADSEYTYQFVGWSANPNATTGTADNALPPVTSNVIYYAIFKATPQTYTVIFDAQGGNWNENETQRTGTYKGSSTSVTRPEEPTKSGYLFVAWTYENANGSYEEIPNGAPLTVNQLMNLPKADTANRKVTLYAKWRLNPEDQITYTIHQHFMKDADNEDGAINYYTTSQVASAGTPISSLIPNELINTSADYNFKGSKYLYEAAKIGTVPYTGQETLQTEKTEIHLYYYLDSLKDADKDGTSTDKDSLTGGDGIPDYKQILIQYQVYQKDNGLVTPEFEVVTVKDNKELTAIHGSSVTKAGTGYTFVTWTGQNVAVNETTVDKIVAESTKLHNKNCDPSGDTFEQGKSYTYTAIFLEDKIGGGDNKDQPDEIPDRYQVTINYVDDNTGRGKITGLTKEVKTIYVNGKEGKWASKGKVVASGSTATATGSRCYFSRWTNDAKVDTSKAGAALGQQTIENAEGGKTYTFTANFGRSSGGHSGGGTVTIPDDVPTGLNGKDHYAYVVGYPDGMVYPQKNITRAEVATIFFRLLKDETREANMTKSNSYNDMKDGAWYTCAVSTLSKMGIIKGYEDGSFKPDASISRAEFAAIAARFDPDGDKTPATFSDVSSHWAKDEISIAANHGWIKGYEDGSFKPDQKITRAETMTLVNRVLKRLPETKDDLHKDMKTWPDNQKESAWFYLAVQEATNSHYQKLKKDGTHETWESMRETRDWAALEK